MTVELHSEQTQKQGQLILVQSVIVTQNKHNNDNCWIRYVQQNRKCCI